MTTINDFDATSLSGSVQHLAAYAGQVVLVVNTASRCGFTPQYEGLERLWQQYGDDGLVVLGFPCNQFGKQEPGDGDVIGEFCERNHGVTFPMFDKVEVNGPDAHPLFVWLRSQRSGVFGNRIKWNFTKFLLGRDGGVIRRYGSATKPEKLVDDIEAAVGIRTTRQA